MMNEQPMTCNRKSEVCLRLFGVNILPRKPITASDSQSLSHSHEEKKIHKEKICKDEDLYEELDHNNTMGKATRVGAFQFSRMVNLNHEEKGNYENSKNHKDFYFDYLRNSEFIRSNINVGRNNMMMMDEPIRESMMNWPLKENYKGGYFSEMFLQRGQSFPDKKNKGKPWTEQEHRYFLCGLKNVGKGNWKEISKKYVRTKTPTQVASHAQKYFLRISAFETRKRRRSLFDIPLEEEAASKVLAVSKI